MCDPVNIATIMDTNQWAIGVLGSLIGGAFLAGIVTAIYRGERSSAWNGLPMGLIERFFFTIGVAFALPGIGVAMIGWLTVKMVTGWNRAEAEGGEPGKRRRMSALAGGLTSMFFATIGGLICAGRIFWDSAP